MKKESKLKEFNATPMEKNFSREKINNSGLPPMSANMRAMAQNESNKMRSALGQYNSQNG